MKKIALLVFLFLSFQIQAKKRALIIAIGAYPAKTGWSTISSANDVPLIKQTLVKQGFLDVDIEVLLDLQATRQGIETAMQQLLDKSEKGDIVVIHYSGHGQQIFDDNGDEIDDKDEALVPYDAFAKYTFNYTGQNHLRDDQIGTIITSFRNKLGKTGQLLMLLDSCHSGSSTRGGKTRGGQPTFAPPAWTPKPNEKTPGSAMFEKEVISKDASPFVMITGASADELNYEFDNSGSLSYSFAKAMTDLGTDFTYRQLYSKIVANMNVISPKQTPTIEGNMDYKLFKGEYVAQQTYYDITKISRPNLIQINAGKLNGLFQNTTIFILPEGTVRVDNAKVIAKGTITNANFNSATITLDKNLADTNQKKYWVFVDKPSYGNIALKVFIEASITDKTLKDGIAAYLSKNHIGEVVSDANSSSVVITKEGTDYALNISNGIDAVDKVETSRGSSSLDLITQKLFNYAQGQYLKDLSLKNHDYEFEFKLLPIDYNSKTNTTGELKPENSYVNKSGIFEVNTTDNHVVLQVTNKSSKPLYFSIIEINSKGEINPFMPNNNCTLTNDERKIAPGKTMIFKDCVYSFGPPYERLLLKGFATSTPINFQPTVETRGGDSRGISDNPLEGFIKQSYNQSRGSESTKVSDKVDGYSTEFVYEIVK